MEKDSQPCVSAVVPCYNEESTISECFSRLQSILSAATGDQYEIVFVDDGSSDDTWSILSKICNDFDAVKAVRLSRNHGHQLALSAGLDHCTGSRTLILDADLQDPPELLDDMLKIMDDGADVVYGQRIRREGETFLKKLYAAIFYRLLAAMTSVNIPVDTGDFRLINERVLNLLRSMPEQHRFIRGMVAWVGLDQRALPYRREKRFAGETKYPLGKLIGLAINGIVSFSIIPLRMAAYLGFIVTLFAICMTLYVCFSWAFTESVSGWASLMTVILTLSGVQLLMLGVIGEYVGRIFVESKRRPLYIIDTIKYGVAMDDNRVRKGKPDLNQVKLGNEQAETFA